MDRRAFLSVSSLSFSYFLLLSSCARSDNETTTNEVEELHNKYMELYNNGNIEKIMSDLYEVDCTYISDNISGGFQLAKRSLSVLNKYQQKKGILPLKVLDRNVRTVGNIAWISCELVNNSNNKRHGFLTQIFYKRKSQWKIVHDHFSK